MRVSADRQPADRRAAARPERDEPSAAILATGPEMAQARADMAIAGPVGRAPAMTERPKSAEAARRGERLAAAVRENLKRRKAQARSRSAPPPPAAGAGGTPAHDSAGFPADKRKR